MRLVIQGAALTVTVKSDKELDTKQIVMAHQLATGNYEALFVDQDQEPEEVEEEQTKEYKARQSPTSHPSYYLEKGDSVKVQVMCPFCGYVGKTMGRWSCVTYCPKCNGKLFNKFATDKPGEPDKGGYIYHATEPLHQKDDDLAQAFGVDSDD